MLDSLCDVGLHPVFGQVYTGSLDSFNQRPDDFSSKGNVAFSHRRRQELASIIDSRHLFLFETNLEYTPLSITS